VTGTVRPWYACTGDPCTCPKPVSIDYRVAKLERVRALLDEYDAGRLWSSQLAERLRETLDES